MWRAGAAALACAALALPAWPAAAGQGTGTPSIAANPATLTGEGPWTVQVTGTDYLVPPYPEGGHVDGGVYLFFGWVDTSKTRWGPSGRNTANPDGNYGTTYAYPGAQGGPGSGSDNDSVGVVGFTPSTDPAEADAPVMDRDGNWSAPVKVPGPTFTYKVAVPDENGDPVEELRSIDCRAVQCGVFTFGAHGIPSRTNEKFTPLSFAADGQPTPTPAPQENQPTPQPTAQPDPGQPTPEPTPAPTPVPDGAGPQPTPEPTPAPTAAGEGQPSPTVPAAATEGSTDGQGGGPAPTPSPTGQAAATGQGGAGPSTTALAKTGGSGQSVPLLVAGSALIIGGAALIHLKRHARREETDGPY